MLILPFFITLADDDNRIFMESLFQQYHRLMIATVWQYTHNRDMTEDIVSDSLVALIHKTDKLRRLDDMALRAYIIATVRNTTFNALKKANRLSAYRVDLSDESLANLTSSECFSENMLLEASIVSLLKEIRTLSDKERMILTLKYIHQLDNADLAHMTDLSTESIRQYLSRAKRKLQHYLLSRKEEHL